MVRLIPFAEYCAKIQEHLERAYHVNVVTRDIPDPLTGDLDGLEIHIDPAVSAEQRLFLLAHLFGHTVQWNVNPGAFEIGKLFQPPVNDGLLATIMEYEQEAASLALSVFHQIGITNADQWFSDYSACDLAYLRHYYRTGEKKSFQSFWRDNGPRIEPKPIPPFKPRKRVFRCNGVDLIRQCLLPQPSEGVECELQVLGGVGAVTQMRGGRRLRHCGNRTGFDIVLAQAARRTASGGASSPKITDPRFPWLLEQDVAVVAVGPAIPIRS